LDFCGDSLYLAIENGAYNDEFDLLNCLKNRKNVEPVSNIAAKCV
jgi:hypothetical protein